MHPKVSIIIRSKNDIAYIQKTLTMIREQEYLDYEIIHVDSGSTDGTYERVQGFKPEVSYQIRPEDYIPGRVLNEAIQKCRGEMIVFNNSDCVPQNRQWLGELVKPLELTKKIVSTFGRQVPRTDAHPLIIKDYERAFGSGEISGQWFHFFSLATSAALKSILTEYPFNPALQYSEDIEWSYRVKKMGYKIQYVPLAMVEHSHNYTLPQVRKRFYGEGFAEGRIYQDEPRDLSLWGMFIRPWMAETLRDYGYLIKTGKIQLIPYATVYRYYQKQSVYQGNHDYLKSLQKS
jgi:rhamnosyltransferase